MSRVLKLSELMALSLLVLSISVGVLLILKTGFMAESDQITGHVSALVNISRPINASCNTTFYPDWNLVSFFCISTLEDLNVFAATLPSHTHMYTYRVSSDSSDPWKVYNPSLPSWVIQDLGYFSRRDAYWIFFDSINISENYIYEDGSKRIPTNIDLLQGWNLVGYPTDIARNITESFSSINTSYELVYWFNNTNKTFRNYTNGLGGDFNITYPYQGFWINMSSSGTLVVDW